MIVQKSLPAAERSENRRNRQGYDLGCVQMTVELEKGGRSVLAPLFSGFASNMYRSCIQGHMGRAWADDAENPTCGRIMVGDMFFLAGRPDSPAAREMVSEIPSWFCSEELYFVPESDRWSSLIESCHKGRCRKIRRYAFIQETAGFDKAKLAAMAASLPAGYEIRRIDEKWYGEVMKHAWSRDLCSQFESAGDYAGRGIGFCVIHGGEVVAGASSYALYDDGIEIQIDTREDHRRKGLAAACGAALILECLKRGLYPGWDAANMASLKLAEKLGYRLKGHYDAWAVRMTQPGP